MTAVFSLVAVIVGALEHESLLFQPDAPWVTSASSGTVEPVGLATTPVRGDRWSDVGSTTGTEGTFRSECHALWTGPAANDRPLRWSDPSAENNGRARALSRGVLSAKSRKVAVLVLRL